MTMLMATGKKTALLLLPSFVCCLLSTASTISAIDQGDLFCLRSIKSSVKDHFGSLNTWSLDGAGNGDICTFKGIVCDSFYTNRVQTITLQGLGLKGKFPQGIRNCTSLTALDLSSNNFFGHLPSNMDKLIPYVKVLNLSHNRFSGEIPSSMASCVRLNRLLLNRNQLTGQIPPELGQLYWILELNVAHNHLSGPVPTFLTYSAIPESYADNKGLCGGPLKPCQQQGKSKDSFISGFVVGWALSAVSVTAICMFICMPGEHLINMLVKRRKKKKRVPHEVMLITRKMKKREPHKARICPITEISTVEKLATRIPLTDIASATNNFSQENIIGFGKTGTMYKAAVMNGCLLAVKRFYSQHFEKQFIYEILILGRLRHPNLVPLLGFCTEMNKKFLVYEYMGYGNLHQWLHPHKAEAKILEWPLRARIGLGLARGLAWLHHNSMFLVAHCDISSKCILLDQNFEPKISNFGRATLMKSTITDSTRGLFVGSADTEMKCGQSPLKKDVYNFGIVLLEMITGKKPHKVSDAPHRFDGTLVDWINHLLNTSGLQDAIDKSLTRQGFDGEIFQFLKVACRCVKASPHQRPTMLEVDKILRNTTRRHQTGDDYESCGTSNNRDEHRGVQIMEESIEIEQVDETPI